MIILGCFYSRIEGPLEASNDGGKTVVREMERLSSKEGIPPEAVPLLIEEAIDRWEPRSRRSDEVSRSAREAAREVVRDEEVAGPIVREARLVDAFAEWLNGEGWVVRRRQIDRGRQVDLLATRGEEVLLVETKAYVASPVSTAAVQQAAALRSVYPDLRAALPGYHARAALVVNAEPGVSAAALDSARTLGVEVYSVDASGDVHLLVDAGPP